jgi:spore coat protein U-like protein
MKSKNKCLPAWTALLLTVLAETIFSQAALAGGLSLEADSVTWTGNGRGSYYVFDPVTQSQTSSFVVSRGGGSGRVDFFVTFSGASPGAPTRVLNGNNRSLQYQIYDSLSFGSVLGGLPSATSSQALRGRFSGAEQKQQFTFVIAIPGMQICPPGEYSGAVTLTLCEGTLDRFTEIESHTIRISSRVSAATELSLVSQGSAFTPDAVMKKLDFGSLTKDKWLGFDLRVRSNTVYDVLLESENGGHLKSGDPKESSVIPYTLTIAGASVDLRQRIAIAGPQTSARSTEQGERLEMVVKIGDTEEASAGSYRDNIIITVVGR